MNATIKFSDDKVNFIHVMYTNNWFSVRDITPKGSTNQSADPVFKTKSESKKNQIVSEYIELLKSGSHNYKTIVNKMCGDDRIVDIYYSR